MTMAVSPNIPRAFGGARASAGLAAAVAPQKLQLAPQLKKVVLPPRRQHEVKEFRVPWDKQRSFACTCVAQVHEAVYCSSVFFF